MIEQLPWGARASKSAAQLSEYFLCQHDSVEHQVRNLDWAVLISICQVNFDHFARGVTEQEPVEDLLSGDHLDLGGVGITDRGG